MRRGVRIAGICLLLIALVSAFGAWIFKHPKLYIEVTGIRSHTLDYRVSNRSRTRVPLPGLHVRFHDADRHVLVTVYQGRGGKKWIEAGQQMEGSFDLRPVDTDLRLSLSIEYRNRAVARLRSSIRDVPFVPLIRELPLLNKWAGKLRPEILVFSEPFTLPEMTMAPGEPSPAGIP